MAIKNKQIRSLQHIKRKRAENSAKHTLRHERRKEEAKNPSLRAERLARSVPLTLDRKRTWDEIGSDDENLLGLSVDIEKLKRQRQEEEEENNNVSEEEEVEGGDDNDDDADEVDSMIMTDSEDDDDDNDEEEDKEEGDQDSRRKNKKNTLPSATERATSPTHSTKSTNLNMAPEALAAKFPTLFSSDTPKPPKILITTGLHSTLHHEAKLLTSLFPNSVYIRRSAHYHSHKFSVKEISKFASNRNYTALVIVNEDQKKISGLDIVHLPVGPMFHFSVSNWIEGKKLPGHGKASEEYYPELILNNFRSPLGILTAHLFKTLWPAQPHLEGRQVVTIHNQRDYCFVRRHRYVFREKRETEKPVVGADGKEMKGVEGIKAGLQELGPRMTLKLRRVDKGIQRASGQEWEWKGKMEKTRTKFQL